MLTKSSLLPADLALANQETLRALENEFVEAYEALSD